MNKLILNLFVFLTLVSLLVSGSHQANGFQRVVLAAQVNGTWQNRGSVFHIWSQIELGISHKEHKKHIGLSEISSGVDYDWTST